MRKKWPSRTSVSSQNNTIGLFGEEMPSQVPPGCFRTLSRVASPVYLLLLPRMCRETYGITLVGADAESGCHHLFLLLGIFAWWSDWLVSTHYVTVVSLLLLYRMVWIQRVPPIPAQRQQSGRHMSLFVVFSLYRHILFTDFISMQHSLKNRNRSVQKDFLYSET